MFMVLSSWQAIARVHVVHLVVSVDSVPGGYQLLDQANRLGTAVWVRSPTD